MLSCVNNPNEVPPYPKNEKMFCTNPTAPQRPVPLHLPKVCKFGSYKISLMVSTAVDFIWKMQTHFFCMRKNHRTPQHVLNLREFPDCSFSPCLPKNNISFRLLSYSPPMVISKRYAYGRNTMMCSVHLMGTLCPLLLIPMPFAAAVCVCMFFVFQWIAQPKKTMFKPTWALAILATSI